MNKLNNLKILGKEHVGQITFTGIEGGFGQNKKAMLVRDIAQIHNSTTKRINELINRNIKRFKENIDVIDLLSKENFKVVLNDLNFSSKAISNSNHIYLLSERGYAKLLKILDDDKAWDIYDQLVDNYFNMRVAIKENEPSIVEQKRLNIMQKNASTRKANLLYKIAMATKENELQENLLAKAASELTGERILPDLHMKYYTAKEVGTLLGVSAWAVGHESEQLKLKAPQPNRNEYGKWVMTKSQYSEKEVYQWLYTDKAVAEIKKGMKK